MKIGTSLLTEGQSSISYRNEGFELFVVNNKLTWVWPNWRLQLTLSLK